MTPDDALATSARLMSEFAVRTGLSAPKQRAERYLWTDAFAVCNFIELFRRTGDEKYLRYATDLIDQVHRVLGRYRDDDARRMAASSFFIEPADPAATAGGLRIGKPLKERDADEPV